MSVGAVWKGQVFVLCIIIIISLIIIIELIGPKM